MSMGENVKVAVVGASGYTGQELVRLLLQHPRIEIACVTSRSEAGRLVTDVFPRFKGSPKVNDLPFIAPDVEKMKQLGVEAAFLALPHGVAASFAEPLIDAGIRVIDLSADFRLRSPEIYEEFYGAPHPAPHLLEEAVYGLPEVYGEQIEKARLIASPGCYPTSVLLPLLPILKEGLINPETICVSSMSSASGAGKKTDPSLLFCEVNESVRAYGAPKHRHLSEIEQELSLASQQEVKISFVPHLLPTNAGIATTIFADLKTDPQHVSALIAAAYQEAYENSSFVRVLGEGVFGDTKNVARTNFVDIGWVIDDRTNRLILSSAEDNLGKGAGSQGVQSFNVIYGFPETEGLLHF